MTIRKEVIIGDCRLLLADCQDVLPTLGKVDAVVDNSNAVVFNGEHESASRKHSEKPESASDMGSPSQRHSGELCERDAIAASNGRPLSSNPDGLPAGNSAHGHSSEIERQGWQTKRSLQGRDAKYGLPQDDREKALQQVRGNEPTGDSPQGQYPHEQRAGESGSALQPMSQQPPQARMVERKKGWAILTDPPYGIGMDGGKVGKSRYDKKDWDSAICWDELSLALSIAEWAVVFGGNYYPLPPSGHWLIWDKQNDPTTFADFEMAWTNLGKSSRMIRHLWSGPYMKVREQRWHPTQKPVGVMEWCIKQLPDTAQTILDPFMGSGTTGVACVKMGRKFIGIEREPEYFEIACRRIREAYAQPDMFIEPPKKMEQEALL